MQMTFNAIFEKDGEWWVGQAVELPAALSQGATLEECRENLRGAIEDVLEFLRDSSAAEHREPDVIRERLAVEVA